MENPAQSAYLQTEILTATPQKLRLMLIDGAIRFAKQARECRNDGRDEQATIAVARCRSIVTELLASVKVDASDVAQKVAGIYAFLFRALTDTNQLRDVEKLSEIIEVLEVERETWQQLCRDMPQPPASHRSKYPPEITAETTAAIRTRPTPIAGSANTEPQESRIRLQA